MTWYGDDYYDDGGAERAREDAYHDQMERDEWEWEHRYDPRELWRKFAWKFFWSWYGNLRGWW